MRRTNEVHRHDFSYPFLVPASWLPKRCYSQTDGRRLAQLKIELDLCESLLRLMTNSVSCCCSLIGGRSWRSPSSCHLYFAEMGEGLSPFPLRWPINDVERTSNRFRRRCKNPT